MIKNIVIVLIFTRIISELIYMIKNIVMILTFTRIISG